MFSEASTSDRVASQSLGIEGKILRHQGEARLTMQTQVLMSPWEEIEAYLFFVVQVMPRNT